MRFLPIFSAVLLVAVLPAQAQVTVDLGALHALPDRGAANQAAYQAANQAAAHATRAATATANVAPPPATPPAATPPAATPPAATPPAATPPAPQPALPENVPGVASVAAVAPPVIPKGVAPPAPPPVSDKSATAASATTLGLRLNFASGESDLSPDSVTAIKQGAEQAPPGDATTFNILAYAAGKPDDPSTARRLSLARAMAVRTVLVANGIASAHIFVRAMGDRAGDGPADRVDLNITGPEKAAAQ